MSQTHQALEVGNKEALFYCPPPNQDLANLNMESFETSNVRCNLPLPYFPSLRPYSPPKASLIQISVPTPVIIMNILTITTITPVSVHSVSSTAITSAIHRAILHKQRRLLHRIGVIQVDIEPVLILANSVTIIVTKIVSDSSLLGFISVGNALEISSQTIDGNKR